MSAASRTDTFHRTCNLCEATCGLLIDVENERVRRIRADPDDPFSRGHICPKAIGLSQVQEDPDRLRHPVRRTASGWERVSWDGALNAVAEGAVRVQRRYGQDAFGTYLGNPAAHNFGTIFYLSPLYRAIGTRNRYSASSLDQNPHHASSLFLFGDTFTIPVPDLDRTDFLLMLGANPVVSNGSLMTAPGARRRLRALRERGGRLVVVDPRRTETAALADEHVFIAPGRDALLLAALIHTVLEADHTAESHAWAHVDGLDALRAALAPFSPEAVEPALGIDAERVRRLAREFAQAASAACYGRVGICLNPFGTLNAWLVGVLNLVTGNLDRPGGWMFPTPAIDLAELARRFGGTHPQWRTRVRGAPSFEGEQPSACLAEELLTPGEGQIRGMLTIAGNPVLSAPNGAAIGRGLAGLEFFAAVDLYVNETTRHADWILPPTWSLEHDNYEVLFHMFAVRNTAKYSRPVLEPPPGAKHEWQILSELALRISAHGQPGRLRRLGLRALRFAIPLAKPRRVIDWSLRAGPYGDGFRPWRRGLRLSMLEANRKGVDLGPLQPSLDRLLGARGQRIDLAHAKMIAELERLRGTLAAGASPGNGDTLLMIGRRDVRTNNSWLHNVPLAAKGRDRCTLIANPEDAKRLGLESAEWVAVRSRVGRVVARLEVSDEVMPGVVSLPHGWGHGGEGIALNVAQKRPGVSYNDVADDQLIEAVVGNAVLNGVPVTLEAVAAP